MRNPFTGGDMISVQNGSLADFFEHGGTEEDIINAIRVEIGQSGLDEIDVADPCRVKFEWPDKNIKNCLFEVGVWILRIAQTGDDEADFRWFYSSQGLQEELTLRGWNA
jgi:hypothetical protein